MQRLPGTGTVEAAVTQELKPVALPRGRYGIVACGPHAQAAVLALTCGAPGIYNIAEDDGAVSIEKARRELGFDPASRA
jgi:hypothetical protein